MTSHTRFSGVVAQLGERVVRNDEVVGSIPIGSTTGASQSEVPTYFRYEGTSGSRFEETMNAPVCGY